MKKSGIPEIFRNTNNPCTMNLHSNADECWYIKEMSGILLRLLVRNIYPLFNNYKFAYHVINYKFAYHVINYKFAYHVINYKFAYHVINYKFAYHVINYKFAYQVIGVRSQVIVVTARFLHLAVRVSLPI